jgi:hypothetical protein
MDTLIPPALQEALRAGLAAEYKVWRKTLPRPCHLLPLLVGDGAWPVYQPVFTLCFLVVLFYVKLLSLTRVVSDCGGGAPDPALRAPPSALRSMRRAWAAVSLLGGLALFVAEAWSATQGGARLMPVGAAVRAPGEPAGKPRSTWLVLAWGACFSSLAVDAALTALALAPFFLRLAAALLPPLWARAYPVPEGAPEGAPEGGGGGDHPAPAKPPALGTTCEALRRLDCSDLVVGRLLELSLLYCFHKYQN